MAKTAMIEIKGQDSVASLQEFLRALLTRGEIGAVLVAQHLPMKNVVMPVLVTDESRLGAADPLAPAFPMNAAKILSRLTRKPLGTVMAAVLRPCEIRAFVELVKLKQGSLDDVVLIGLDCLGAYSNVDYAALAAENGTEFTRSFCAQMLDEKGFVSENDKLAGACRACEYPVPENADVLIGLVGGDTSGSFFVKANTDKRLELLDKLRLPSGQEPPRRKEAVADLVSRRTAFRDKMFEETSSATSDPEKLMSYLANCVNCYNCRVACPVCYCKECVFVTDVFDHEPSQYLRWARRKGILKMPTDTVFFHLTRLAHMSTACVGCGQCSNACPNNVPVMQIFRTISSHTQRAFDYHAGMSVEEEPPLSSFREHEFSEVTGGRD